MLGRGTGKRMKISEMPIDACPECGRGSEGSRKGPGYYDQNYPCGKKFSFKTYEFHGECNPKNIKMILISAGPGPWDDHGVLDFP